MADELNTSYLGEVIGILQKLATEEGDALRKAGSAVADRIAEDRLIFVIGPGGHSQIGAEEAFSRAGGLACIYAFLDQGFYLGNGSERSMNIERTPGYARALLRDSELGAGDVLIIVNAYGINSATIDSADVAREVGALSIGITSIANQRGLPKDHPSRHPTKRDLCDLVDIVIDTKMPLGDAVLQIDGVREKVGPVSTYVNAFAVNSVMIEATAELARRGIDPPVWRSGNSPGGDEANRAAMAKYKPRVKYL
jgi:uncharacterized phosphosugar-binding protein